MASLIFVPSRRPNDACLSVPESNLAALLPDLDRVIKASWFVVFLPLLLCLMIFCVSPCLQWSSLGDGVVYFAAMFAGWLPALLCILLVCAR